MHSNSHPTPCEGVPMGWLASSIHQPCVLRHHARRSENPPCPMGLSGEASPCLASCSSTRGFVLPAYVDMATQAASGEPTHAANSVGHLPLTSSILAAEQGHVHAVGHAQTESKEHRQPLGGHRLVGSQPRCAGLARVVVRFTWC